MTDLHDSHLGQAWLVLILALVFGGTLAGVHVGLEERIEANLRAETLGRIPDLILGSALTDDALVILGEESVEIRSSGRSILTLSIAERTVADHRVFEVSELGGGRRLGWVVRGAGPGYADRIEVLVGLDAEVNQVTGLWVLSQKETPALGDGIVRRAFRDRFVGAPIDRPLVVSKDEELAAADPSKILALTAATISSQSVCDIVNETVAEVRSQLEP